MYMLSTRIIAVTVYPDRARITRRGDVKLEAGLQTLAIADLPLQLTPNSVRASAYGAARARLLGVQVSQVNYAHTPAETVLQLEQEIENLQDQITGLNQKSELVKHYRTLLDLLSGHTETYATALAAGEIDVTAQLAQFDTLQTRSETLNEQGLKISIQRRTLERKLQKLQNDLKQHQGQRPRQRYQATVEVEMLEAGELNVELTYVVSNASWKPLYDLRFTDQANEQPSISLEVGYLGQVAQQTGESWEDVRLTLSTARPALAARLPELDPWYIQPRPPAPALQAVRAASPNARQAGLLSAVEDEAIEFAPMAAPAPVMKAEEAVAKVETGGAAVTYQLTAMATVPPDGSEHKVTVARFSLSPDYDYISAPKLVSAVYRRAKAVNASPYLLLPGLANIFLNEEFIGMTQIELTAPQEKLEAFLGVDDRVRIEREMKRRDVDKRIIGGKRRLVYGYTIEIENLLPGEARLTVRDHLPVSRHEEIRVRLETAEPRASEQTELNLLTWEFKLAPKEKRAIRYDYSVETPQDMVVVGLP